MLSEHSDCKYAFTLQIKQINKQTHARAERERERQTDRQTDRQTETERALDNTQP